MKLRNIIVLIIFLSLTIISGCIEYKEENEFINNLKSDTKYEVLKIESYNVYYYDENNRIQKISIRNNEFFILEFNETYLRRQIYGGLMDFEQWTLYIKK